MLALAFGLLVGACYGYIAERGAFCLNSGFRLVVTKRDHTKVKAYALALALQMLFLPAVFASGFATPTVPGLFPWAAMLGGGIFGFSMAFAGGCAAGVWYKSGSGSAGAMAAVAGMAIGAVVLDSGPLTGIHSFLQSWAPVVGDPANPLWTAAPVVGVLLLLLLSHAAPGTAGVWSWGRTGLLLGGLGLLAWPLSSWAGRQFGLAVLPGTTGLLTAAAGGISGSTPWSGLFTWDILSVLGIPLGAYAAAHRGGQVRWQPVPWRAAIVRFSGGLGLGVGAALAAGCTVGHGLTGVSLLAPGSMLTLLAIFAGRTVVALWGK